MEIKYLKNSEIDRSKWDACINASLQQLPYGYSWYLDAAADHWDAIVLGDYAAVFPLPLKKKWGVRYVYPPFFIQQLGLFSSQKLELTDAVLNEATKHFKFIELYLNFDNQCSLSVVPRNNFELNLIDLQQTYSENTRRNIKKAEGLQLKIQKASSAKNIIELFRKGRGAQVKTLDNSDYKRFEKIVYACEKRSAIEHYEVHTAQGCCAGACLLKTEGRVVFIFSGNSDEGKKSGAMHYLIDSMINEYAGKPMIFDFEGSNDENLARFYQSFGAKNTPYSFVKINNLPFPLNLMKG
ncbi:MAG: GNAT family N-acetyltransferase [Flavobacteriales bacterium]